MKNINKFLCSLTSITALILLTCSFSYAARHGGGGHPGGGHPGGGHPGGGGGHPHLSAGHFARPSFHSMMHVHTAFHPSVSHLHHINGFAAHSTLHTHPAANTTNAAAALVHTRVHTTAASRLSASPSVSTSHPSFTMHAHRGIPGGAMAGFNRGFNRGGFNNNYNGNGYGNGYNGYDSDWYWPSLFYSMFFPDEYPYFDPFDDYNDYYDGYPSMYNSYYPAPAATNAATNYNQYQPAAESWVAAENGDVPDNAVVNGNENNVTTYYCREEFNGKMYYGLLIPKDGCYVQEQSVTMKFENYDVMVQ